MEISSQSGVSADPTNDYSYSPTATGEQAQWDDCPQVGDCIIFVTGTNFYPMAQNIVVIHEVE